MSDEQERLFRSSDRVRQRGEVFTPSRIVEDMLDLLPEAMWDPSETPTYLEPACGDGNFLVAVLDRRLRRLLEAWENGGLPDGTDAVCFRLHALRALSGIYGMDISTENIEGGTEGHPIGARARLVAIFERYLAMAGASPRSDASASAGWIVEHNIQVVDMLPSPGARPSSRDDVVLIEYEWNTANRSVVIRQTSLAAVALAFVEAPTLFETPSPTPLWSGPAESLHAASSRDLDRGAQTPRAKAA